MQTHAPSQRARLIAPAAALAVLGGCQAYKRAPLDLPAHRAAMADRLGRGELISAYAERLADQGGDAPDRFDPSDGLSPAEGETLALFFNPDVRLARLQAGVALASAETAGLWQDPVFGFDGAEILSSSAPFEYGLTLSLTIPISGRLGVEKARAEAAYEAELRRVVDAEWDTRASVRVAWGAWTAARGRLELLRGVVAQVERIAGIADRLEEAGELTRVESRLLRAELIRSRSELIDAQLSAERARVDLMLLMGLPVGARVELSPAFSTPPAPAVDDDARRLIESNTALAVRRAEYAAAEQALRLEVREQYPDITIGGGYGSEGDDRLLLGVSIPIPILNANRGGIAEARARREVARAAAETTFERLARDLVTARASLDAARSQRETFEGELVPMLDEQASEIERLIDLGEVDTLLLLETVRGGYETKSRLLELRQAEARWAIEVARLLGPDTPPDAPPDAIEPASQHTNEETAALRAAAAEETTP